MSLIEKAAAKLKKAKVWWSGPPRKRKKLLAARPGRPLRRQSLPAFLFPKKHRSRQIPAVNPKTPAPRLRLILILCIKNILTDKDLENTVTAEEFRIVKRSLLLNAFSKGEAAIRNGNIVMVTSTQPDEGKTFCAVSLAMSMAAERDLTVLLVDADVAKPDVLRTLGVKGSKGLIDVIENKDMDLSECLLKTNIPNLTILPAGKKHKLTTELLASGRMGEIIDEIARRYHDRIVIIDSPPVLASSAASVLALNVGQILFVVEAERTREGELTDALKMIENNPNISFILNKTRFSAGKKKFGSYYGYGYN